MQDGQSIHRIDDARAVNLFPAGLEAVKTGTGRADHAVAVLGGGDIRLVGRIAGGQHQHPVQAHAFQGTLRHADVPLMDGIEGSSHDADAFPGHVLPPAYFSCS